MRLGTVVLVGVGPGDVGLLTLIGKSYIEKADCIFYDRITFKEMLGFAKSGCEFVYVGKSDNEPAMSQDRINELMYEKTRIYENVVSLKGGDPYVFGRGAEEALYLLDRGLNVKVVPGVSSAIAAVSAAGIPATHNGMASSLRVMTAEESNEKPAYIDYSLLLDTKETLVFLKGFPYIKDIAKGLMDAGRSAETKIAVISNATTARQKKCTGTLSDIVQKVEISGMKGPGIIVVGEVVSMAEKLDFFEQRPLFGRKIFLPYVRRFQFSFDDGGKEVIGSGLESTLKYYGADVLSYKVGSIVPVDFDPRFLKDLRPSDRLVFTSQNGVYAFFWNLKKAKLDVRAIGNAGVAAVGSMTAETLRKFGIMCDYVSEKQAGEDLGRSLVRRLYGKPRFYWLCSADTASGMEEEVRKKAQFRKVICYEDKKDFLSLTGEEKDEIASCDGVVFTSASNIRRTLEATGGVLPSKVYSMGPECSQVLDELGITERTEAILPTYEGIVEALLSNG